MNITVIGACNMGSALVQQLHAAGHQVRVTARHRARAEALARQYPGVQAGPAAGAARDADAVIVATAYGDAVAALRALGDLTGKVVIDITNPLTADYLGLTLGHRTSAAEEIAAAVPEAQVVKAFNTIFAPLLALGADPVHGERIAVFLASDSRDAKQTVKALAESMGFDTVDAGGLRNARYLEPLAGLNVYLGYGAGLGATIAPAWIHYSARRPIPSAA